MRKSRKARIRFIPEYNLFLFSSQITCLHHREQRLVISGDTENRPQSPFRKLLAKLRTKALSFLPGAVSIVLIGGMTFMFFLVLADVACNETQNFVAVMP